MATLTIRNLPQETHDALKARAASAGRSVEAEVRQILKHAALGAEAAPSQAALAERVAKARAILGARVLAGPSMADELIAERCTEAARE
jgi:plasmid stability protein